MMRKRLSNRNGASRRRRSQVKTEITYKRSKAKLIAHDPQNQHQIYNIHKKVYLPEFDDFENYHHMTHKDIQTFLG